MDPQICLQCRRHRKNPMHTFCSPACAQIAATLAPELIPIPSNHVLFHSAKNTFEKGCGGRKPKDTSIKGIYLITWPKWSRDEFETYRAQVERRGNFVSKGLSPGNEKKRFRGAERACGIGENGDTRICSQDACKLCQTLRQGFGPYLHLKRTTGHHGTRLSPGIYSTYDTFKACKYATNNRASEVKVLMLCRVVLGEPLRTNNEIPTLMHPPRGFDSVHAETGNGRAFRSDERVIYTEKAIRPQYLTVLGPK